MSFTRRRFIIVSTSVLMATALCSHRISFAANQRKPQQMDEKQFWAIIHSAKVAAGRDVDLRPGALVPLLSSLDLPDIQSFQRRYDDLTLRANQWNLWGAAYLMNGGCSDDGFRYFRDWLISEGRERFESALSNPDSLAEVDRREYFDLESFAYVALKVFAAKGGGELERDFSGELAMPSGKQWSEPELPSLFPRLAAKYLAK
jgi:hypothetical protein